MKRKLLLAALCVVSALGMRAQTDVTSTYLSNADFSQGTLASPAICTYVKDKSSNNTTYANLVALDGWTAVDNGDGKAGGPVAIGSGVWIGGAGYTAPSTNSDGDATGNVLGVVGCWSASAQYKQTLKTGLPAGTYTIVVAVYNSVGGTNEISKNLIGFVEGGGTEHLASTKKYPVNTWKYEYITFTLTAETSGYVTLGYKSTNTGSGNMPHLFISGLEIYEGEVDAAAYEAAKAQKRAKGEWGVAKASAQTALDNSDYAIVTGKERTDLEAEIAKAEPTTVEGYNEATEALVAATATFTAAKAAYNGLASLWNNGVPELIYATTEKYTAIGDAYFGEGDVVDAADATARTAAMQTAIRAYYESHALAENVEGAVNCAEDIAGADPNTNTGWTGGIGTGDRDWEKYTDGSGNLSGKYYDGGWSTSAGVNINMSRTVALPAGTYLLTVTARGSESLTEYKLTIGGEEVNLPKNGSGTDKGVFGHGWDDVSVEFVSDGKPVTLAITAASTEYQQWISFNRFRLMRLELNTDAYADDSYYEALNGAIEVAEANTLGFDAGEYAPYNNVAALEALAAAKAIDPNAELTNLKTDVEALITALENATWTANTADVDAIYNGTFAETGTGSNPKGWTRSNNGWGQQITGLSAEANGVNEGTTTAWYYNTNGAWQYGNDGIYTMPLAANQAYVLSFKYRKNGNDWQNWMKASVVNESNEGLEVAQFSGAENGNTFKSVKAYFTTGEAGNYILSIEQNGNAHLTDVSLVKAASAELAIIESEAFNFESNETYYETVSMTRTIKEGFNTIVLPFSMTQAEVESYFGEDAKVYEVSEYNQTTENLTFSVGEGITANKPVVLKATKATASTSPFSFNGIITKEGTPEMNATNVKMVGSYAATYEIEKNANNFIISGGDLWEVVSDQVTIKNTRAYINITLPEAANIREMIFEGESGESTGISEIAGGSNALSGKIYDLSGREVKNPAKGIYIKGGKKVLVK